MTLKDKRIEWEARYDAWKESGHSIAEWCRNQDIKDHQMYYWVKQFEHDVQLANTSDRPEWLPIQVDEELLPPSGQGSILLPCWCYLSLTYDQKLV